MKRYTKVKVIKITETQSATLIKMKSYGINVCKFIRESISEKIEREHKDLIPKVKEVKPPF